MTGHSVLLDNMVWSYSRIKCYSDCPYRFFLKYIYGCEKTEKFYASYGSFIHKLIEQYYLFGDSLSNDDLVMNFLTGFTENVYGEPQKESTLQKYIDCGIQYFQNFKPFKYPMLAVEKRMKFEIDGFNFVGIIDFLGKKYGNYFIIDNKSRDLKPRSNRKKPTIKDRELDDMLKQLYIYSAAVKQKYGKFPKTLSFNCFKEGVFIEEPFREMAFDEAVKWAVKEIQWIKEDDEFIPQPDYFKCKYICECSNECCYYDWG